MYSWCDTGATVSTSRWIHTEIVVAAGLLNDCSSATNLAKYELNRFIDCEAPGDPINAAKLLQWVKRRSHHCRPKFVVVVVAIMLYRATSIISKYIYWDSTNAHHRMTYNNKNIIWTMIQYNSKLIKASITSIKNKQVEVFILFEGQRLPHPWAPTVVIIFITMQ